jgi:hypothetical protein
MWNRLGYGRVCLRVDQARKGTACVKTKNVNYRVQSYVNIEANSGRIANEIECGVRFFTVIFRN